MICDAAPLNKFYHLRKHFETGLFYLSLPELVSYLIVKYVSIHGASYYFILYVKSCSYCKQNRQQNLYWNERYIGVSTTTLFISVPILTGYINVLKSCILHNCV